MCRRGAFGTQHPFGTARQSANSLGECSSSPVECCSCRIIGARFQAKENQQNTEKEDQENKETQQGKAKEVAPGSDAAGMIYILLALDITPLFCHTGRFRLVTDD